MSKSKLSFSPGDYALFGVTLGISVAIGVFYAVKARIRKRDNTDEFLMAGRSMGAIPVALSVLASFFSASTLLGTPAEIYLRGTQYWMAVFGAVLAPITGAYIFGPFFYKLKVVSVFEYLERRYESKAVRLFGALIFILRSSLGMGIVLYGPAKALNAVTNFEVEAVIAIIGGVCIIYTTLGGLKAVIWTDVFQTLIMISGLLAVIIRGCMSRHVGGLKNMWDISYKGGRIEFFNFDLDPTVRHTLWGLLIGNYITWLVPYSVDQQMVQRFSSTKSLKEAKFALYCNVPGMFIMITLCSLTGLVIYANYAECDPLMKKYITNSNQLLPYFTLDILGDIPGLPGLFMAAMFSGALSSVSSMINSLAAVLWTDFLKLKFGHLSENKATIINKILAFAFGCLGIGLGIAVSKLPGTVLQMSLTFNGSIGAPLLGIFILGVFLPWTNAVGAIVGGILGFALPMWISVGKYVSGLPTKNLNGSIAGCPNDTTLTTISSMVTAVAEVTVTPTEAPQVLSIYRLSYLWLGCIGTVTTVLVGLVVSFVTGARKPHEIEPSLMISYVDKLWCCFPESWKARCRCGINYKESQELQDYNDEGKFPNNFEHLEPSKHQNVYNLTRQ